MRTNSLLERIKIDERICHGKPHIKGTRIHIDIILDSLASGETIEEILESYPRLSKKDIFAALEYASNLTKKEQILQGYKIHEEKNKNISRRRYAEEIR